MLKDLLNSFFLFINSIISSYLFILHDFSFFMLMFFLFIVLFFLCFFNLSFFFSKMSLMNNMLDLFIFIFSIFIILMMIKSIFSLMNENFDLSSFNLMVVSSQWFWDFYFFDNNEMKFFNLNKLNFMENISFFYFNKVFNFFYIMKNELMNYCSLNIIIPMNLMMKFYISSSDVEHCFFLPDMLMKIDSHPGKIMMLDLIFNKLGVFFGNCAEYCGKNHYNMPFCFEVKL